MKTIIDFANKVKSLVDGRMSNIANVETSPSTHPYAVGKQLIFNGLLCKATSAIAVGDTLAVGTNLALSDNVVEQIYSLNQGLTNSLANLSHENLLDNPWFTVNQRSFASTSSALGYTVDRWRVAYNPASNTCELTSNGMVLNSVSKILILQQRFDEEQFKSVVGKMATFSVLLSDGTMYKGSAIFPQKGDASDAIVINNADLYVYYQYNSNSDNLPSAGIYPKVGKTVTIKAVKLELGSVSTLAMDTAPNYAEELLKCQRHFVRFNPTDSYTAFGAGIYSSNNVFAEVTLPTVLRAKPNVSYSTIRAHSYGRNDVNISSIIVNNYINNIVSLKCAPGSGANFVNGDYCELQLDINNYLDLSCDL